MRGLRRRRSLGTFLAVALLAACSSTDDPDGVDRSADASDPSSSSSAADGITSDASDESPGGAPGAELDELRLALPGVASLDPVAASPAAVSDLVLADLLYDTLTVVDDAGRVQPSLATFAANADRTVWRFTLVDAPTFADGSPITPEDVEFSLERVLEQGERSLAALRIESIEDIRVVGPDAVDIQLRSPSAVLPELLSSPLYAVTDDATIMSYLQGGDQTPNASGDYAATLSAVRRLELDRRRGNGPRRIIVQLTETDDGAFDAFLDSQVDWTPVPPDRLGEAVDTAGTDGLQPFQGVLLLGLDVEVPPIDRTDLRRAVALAIDRRSLAAAVFGETAMPLHGLVPLGVPGGDHGCLAPCGPDVEAARAAAAVAFPEGQDRSIRLLVDDSSAQRSVAGVLEEQIEAVGIDVEVDALEATTYEALITSGQQQLFVFGWLGVSRSPASYLAPLFSSGSPDNVLDFADEAIDLQIAAALAEPIASERARRWAALEAQILERVPVVPLVQFRTVAVSQPSVTGILVRADGSIDLAAVRRDGDDD